MHASIVFSLISVRKRRQMREGKKSGKESERERERKKEEGEGKEEKKKGKDLSVFLWKMFDVDRRANLSFTYVFSHND